MPGKVSILFMRDNGHSVRWRVKASLARLLVAGVIVLPLLVAGAVAMSWHLLEERQELREYVAELQQELDRQAQTTVRLSNLEQFLRRHDPETLNTLVLALGEENGPGIETGSAFAEAPQTGEAQPAAAAPSVAPETVSEATATIVPPVTDGGEGASPQAGATAEGSALPTPQEDESLIPAGTLHPEILQEAPVDNGYARVENLVARRIGIRSLRISFDLYNNEKVVPLAGKAAFELVLANGAVYPLSSQGDTTYRINRLKKIVGNPALPSGVTDTTGAMIRVSVFAEGELIYRVLVPLT